MYQLKPMITTFEAALSYIERFGRPKLYYFNSVIESVVLSGGSATASYFLGYFYTFCSCSFSLLYTSPSCADENERKNRRFREDSC